MSLWDHVYLPKTPNFTESTESDNLVTDSSDFDCYNGESEIPFNKNYSKDAIIRPLEDESNDRDCNGLSKGKRCSDDRKNRMKKDSKESIKNENCIRNNNHGKEETDEALDNCKMNSEGNGMSLGEDHHSSSVENVSQNCNGRISENNESKSTVGDGDVMQESTSSSTKTITLGSNDIELESVTSEENNQANKAGDNPNSEPSTPKGGKFKGHRRTHSSDGSPFKNVMKTTSYSEGMSTSAYYAREGFELHSSKVLNNPADNIRLISRFLSHDGLMKCEDENHQRLREMHNEYRGEIRKLQRRVELEREARLAIAQQQRADSVTDDSSRRESENLDDMVIMCLFRFDLLCLFKSTFCYDNLPTVYQFIILSSTC